MKKPRVVLYYVFGLALASVLLTGCQVIDNNFGSFAYVGIGLVVFVTVTIVVVNFTPRRIVLRKLRSLVGKG